MAKNDHNLFGDFPTGFRPREKGTSAAKTLPPWVFARVVDQLTTAVCITDATARILYVNRAFTEMTGEEFLPALREVLGENFFQDSERAQGFRDHEISFDPGNSGEPRWFSCSGVWFREQDSAIAHGSDAAQPTCLLLMANDITSLKRQQEAVGMNAMRALLAEQERVRSMREALQAAIFQMQGPLNLIAAARDLLER
ncbi:MAG: PAS domain-containing protein, partial [Anaerolineales bacterium]|nr:PAS domain-containing protein [Anaerolineales bacterium]